MKQAVTVLIRTEPRMSKRLLWLAVSRRGKPNLWGFPGGKVDPGETKRQAAIRETFEETGFQMDEDQLVELFTEVCKGEVDYETTAYLYTGGAPIDMGLLQAEEGLTLGVKDNTTMCSPDHSPFYYYNIGALIAYLEYLDGEVVPIIGE